MTPGRRMAGRTAAVLVMLQTRRRATAAELASELGVSVATVRRDLGALADAGLPVRPRPGRGGGWVYGPESAG